LTVPVRPDAAQAFLTSSAEDRRKIELVLGLQLERLVSPDRESLSEIMDQMSREAAASGLTPEILQSIIDDE
jgi:hypothetical protein